MIRKTITCASPALAAVAAISLCSCQHLEKNPSKEKSLAGGDAVAASTTASRKSGGSEPATTKSGEATPKKSGGFFSFFRRGGASGGESDKDRAKRDGLESAFIAECAALGGPGGTVAGRDGYYFSATELSRLGQGGRSVNPAVLVIADYAAQLKDLGCDVIVAPLPPRALLYPDKISKKLRIPLKSKRPPQFGSMFKEALGALEKRGVRTVDLTKELLAHRNDKEGAPVTLTGNTLSPRGVQLAAAAIADEVKKSKAGRSLGGNTGVSMEQITVPFTGNLAPASAKPESLAVRNIGRVSGDKVRSIEFKQNGGPVMLIGDRSVLTWREAGNPPGSTGTFASLADQLAAELQTVPDLIMVAEDGRNAPRMKIMKDRMAGRETLQGCKALVWVIPATDLTSSDWQKIPLQLKFTLTGPDIMLR